MDNVTPEYINAKMQLLNISYNAMAKDLKISAPDLGYMMRGHKKLSKVLKAMFFYYLKCKELEMCREWNVTPDQFEQMLAYNLTKQHARAN